MKAAALVLVASLALATALQIPDYSTYSFARYEQEFEKTYASEAERAEAESHFQRNLATIQAHNSKPGITWYMAVNRFADHDLRGPKMQAMKGYNKRMGYASRLSSSSSKSDLRTRLMGDKKQQFSYSPAQLQGLPDSVDWRDKGAVSPVKNQGMCGSCWAFSATESIESHLFLATGQMQILSPQNVLECTPNPNECGGTGGCEGATHELAFTWAEGGIALDSTVPYLAQDAPCNASVPKVAKTGGYVQLPVNDGQALQLALATIGPISVTVDASAWGLYGGGVFTGCNATSPDLDHGVQAVGYGTDAASGLGYWLIRNSWGAGWGEQGYIRIYRGANESCGVDSKPGDGVACKGQTQPVTVCGTCGVWFDTSYPSNVTPI